MSVEIVFLITNPRSSITFAEVRRIVSETRSRATCHFSDDYFISSSRVLRDRPSAWIVDDPIVCATLLASDLGSSAVLFDMKNCDPEALSHCKPSLQEMCRSVGFSSVDELISRLS